LGHRKHSAPRRGSLAFRPRARAKSIVPRVRNWPEIESENPVLLGFPCFKAGTIHVITVDDRERTPNFGKPLFNPATVLALPQPRVRALRLYTKEDGYSFVCKEYRENNKNESYPENVTGVSAVLEVIPRDVGLSQKKPFVFEVGIGGGDIPSRIKYGMDLIGKKVSFSELFKPGMYVDLIGITKGKGFEGPVTRFGVKRKQHKSRKSVRAIGVLGPWHPAAVMYTAPRAGQRGFHQRTETGKRILIVSSEEKMKITPPGGFMHFGVIKGEYAVIKGSCPGPAKRLIIVRFPIRKKHAKILQPQLIEVSTSVRS
jgi:large subunit ribosomal protein L3